MVDKMPLVSHVSGGFRADSAGWIIVFCVKGTFGSAQRLAGAVSGGALCRGRRGASYYGDRLVCSLLGWSQSHLESTRRVVEWALIAWEAPLYRVLEVERKER